MVFSDREEAGRKLAENLLKYKGEDVIVLALPRGGVPIGFEIAKALDAPLDVLVARKLGSPFNPEFGIGAIAPEGVRVLDYQTIEYLRLSEEQIDSVEKKERAELERRIREYRGKDSMPEVENKTVILVDDGLATGVTARAAVQAVLKKNPKKLIVAIPVCAQDAVEGLRSFIRTGIDEIECLMTPYDFAAVGVWYQSFGQLTDAEVIDILNQSKKSCVKLLGI